MGDAGRKWHHVTDPKRARAAVFPSAPVQVMEAGERAQGDERPGPQLPHPSAEREALQPLSTDQRALPEGTARWGANTTASVKPWRPGQGAARWSPGLAGSAVTGVQLVGDRGVSVF